MQKLYIKLMEERKVSRRQYKRPPLQKWHDGTSRGEGNYKQQQTKGQQQEEMPMPNSLSQHSMVSDKQIVPQEESTKY
jgi:hypothetical protein